MNILGTIYLVDEQHIDVARQQLAMNPPVNGAISGGNIICMNMDETDFTLNNEFPDHTMMATILVPPPSAMYKEIDGDGEGFIQDYNSYLEYDDNVQDFITSMLLFMHMGGNILLYTPGVITDDAVWLNTLVLFFFTRYGINIGTSVQNGFTYDHTYDGIIADLLYRKNYIDVIDFVNSIPDISQMSSDSYQKCMMELSMIGGPEENPMTIFNIIKGNIPLRGVPILRSAVTFGGP